MLWRLQNGQGTVDITSSLRIPLLADGVLRFLEAFFELHRRMTITSCTLAQSLTAPTEYTLTLGTANGRTWTQLLLLDQPLLGVKVTSSHRWEPAEWALLTQLQDQLEALIRKFTISALTIS